MVLQIESELIGFTKSMNLPNILKILEIYANSPNKGINLDLFDVLSFRLSYSIDKLNLQEIAQVLKMMAMIGEDRIHFLAIAARVVVERLEIYEIAYEEGQNNVLGFMERKNLLQGWHVEVPSNNLLRLEGREAQICEIENLELPETLKNRTIGDVGRMIYQDEFWDSVIDRDEYLRSPIPFQQVILQGYLNARTQDLEDTLPRPANDENPMDATEDPIFSNPVHLEDTELSPETFLGQNELTINALTTILFSMTKLNFYQDVFY
jgi:hypothetical protein